MRINLGAIASGIANKFVDSFNRANTTSGLGLADDGSNWNILRGSWKILTNKAAGTGDGAGVAAATITVPSQQVTIDFVTSENGVGALLWKTATGDYWSVDINQTSGTQCNASAPYYSVSGYYSYFYCAVSNYSTVCNGYARGTCNGYNHAYYKNGTYCQAYNFNCTGYSTNVTGCASGYTTTNTNYTLQGYYCTSSSSIYPRYLRIISNIGGTISEVTNTYLGNSVAVQAVRAIISGNQITARAYGDFFTAQVGSDLVYTATGATLSTQYGISINNVGYGQGSSVDSLTITRND